MPELKEVPEVAQLLATILTGEPVTHSALAVIPLLAPNLDDPDWLTPEEAGARARITEVSEAGSVPFLQVANGADRPLLLLDGEELLGAKQNRRCGRIWPIGPRSSGWTARRAPKDPGPGSPWRDMTLLAKQIRGSSLEVMTIPPIAEAVQSAVGRN